MSPHAANSLVHDLVEMAKAMETLPQVQAELEEAKRAHAMDGETIQRLEQRLIDRANEIDTLHAKVHAAEVARDTAETMFLETDDKLLAFRRLVSAFSTDAASLLRAQEPQPTPEITDTIETNPVLPAEEDTSTLGQSDAGEHSAADTGSSHMGQTTTGTAHVVDTPNERPDSQLTDDEWLKLHNEAKGSSAAGPTPATESSFGSGSEGSPEWAARPLDPERSVAAQTEGQGVTNPTAPSPAGDTPSPASAPTDGAATVADAPAVSNAEEGPYSGKRWSDVCPRVYSYDVWVRGGGTSDSFNL